MKELYKYIIENTVSGKIDKEVSVHILRTFINNKEISTKDNDIAVIGIALKYPRANNLKEYWSNLLNSVDCVCEFPDSRKKDIDRYAKKLNLYSDNIKYMKAAYIDEIDKFDYSFFNIPPNEAKLMSPNQRLFLQTAWSAIEDAGYSGNKIKGTRTGVFLGASSDTIYDYKRLISETDTSDYSVAVSGNLTPIIASRLSYILDLKGPSITIDTTCSSSLVSTHMACKSIINGECDMAIAGSVKLEILPIEKENKLGIEAYDGKTKAFDNQCDGTGIGEGVAAIILKPLQKAIDDNDSIYAVIKGSAINQDGTSAGLTAPNSLAQSDVIRRAWKDANLDPEKINFIEAHGTGTRLGDPIEIDGIKRAFKKYTKKKQFCAIGSVKSNIGHLYEGAGMASLIKAILTLKNRKIPPTINFNMPNSEINFLDSPVYVNDNVEDYNNYEAVFTGVVSSFGISGTNCHMVLEEYKLDNKKLKSNSNSNNRIFTTSAKNINSLRNNIKNYHEFLSENTDIDIDDLCYTVNTGRGHYNHRLALIVADLNDLRQKLMNIKLEENYVSTDSEIIYGFHKIIPESKKEREYGNITENQKINYSNEGKKIIEQVASSDQCINKDVLSKLLNLYVKGADIEWDLLYNNEKFNRVHLPAYSFDEKHCWIDINESVDICDNLYYNVKWKRDTTDLINIDHKIDSFVILNDDKYSKSKLDNIIDNCNPIGTIRLSDKYEKINDSNYKVSGNYRDYGEVLKEILLKHDHIRIIFTLSNYDKNLIEDFNYLVKKQQYGLINLFNLIKAINLNSLEEKIQIVIITENAFKVVENQKDISPENSTVYGLGKSAVRENPELKLKFIDIDKNTSINNITNEISGPFTNENLVTAYRNDEKYIEEFCECDECINTIQVDNTLNLKKDGIYIITGGTGGIALEIAKRLSYENAKNIALINRSEFPNKNEWDSIIKDNSNRKIIDKINNIKEIESLGTNIEIISTDICEFNKLNPNLNDLRLRYGKINGIIHCAGVSKNDFIINQNQEDFCSNIAPKVFGTWNLRKATENDNLDFFVLFSSIASIFSTPGQAGYSAANTFLDSYVEYLRNEGINAISINWVTWDSVGMALDYNLKDTIFKPLKIQTGLDALIQAINLNMPRIIVGQLNLKGKAINQLSTFPIKMSDNIVYSINCNKEKISVKKSSIKKQNLILSGRTNNEYTDMEKIVAEVWGNVLGFEEINVYDNFFDIGGDSILAMRILKKLNDKLNININISDILNSLNIVELAKSIEKNSKNNRKKVNTICIAEKKEYYQLSSVQKMIYISSQLDTLGLNYNIPQAVLLNGNLNMELLKKSLNKLIMRHEILRTSFVTINNEPVQVIHDECEIDLKYIEGKEEDIQQISNKFVKPFDLSTAPLFRALLVNISKNKNILLFDIHHIVADGLSLIILWNDLVRFYNGEEVEKLEIQYKDFSEWENNQIKSNALIEEKKYWIENLKEYINISRMPTDIERSKVQDFKGDSISFNIDKELTKSLYDLSSKTGTTLYMILLGAYSILLSKYANSSDVIIGSPILGRNFEGAENNIGMFVNTLPIKNYITPEFTIYEYLQEIKKNTLNSFKNQDYPFNELVKDLGLQGSIDRNPLFDCVFTLQNIKMKPKNMKDIDFSPITLNYGITKFDLNIGAMEMNNYIQFTMEYRTSIYYKETIERIKNDYISILNGLVNKNNAFIKDIKLNSNHKKRKKAITEEITFNF